jgi:hypothetical protein
MEGPEAESDMDKRTMGLIGVVVTTLLCGLPGLAGLCIGPLAIWGATLPDNTLEPGDTNWAIGGGIFILVASILFVALPVVIGLLTLKNRKPKEVDIHEPIPSDDF